MTSMPRGSDLPYPFRFYGHRPRAWRASPGGEHFFRLRFEQPPAPEQRTELATTLAATRLDAARGPWLWAGPWALFAVGEEDDPDLFFDDVEDLLLRLHDIAPLSEVVYVDAETPSDSEWEGWTRGQHPQPTPGPAFGRQSSCFDLEQGAQPDCPAPASDPVFEQARGNGGGEATTPGDPLGARTAKSKAEESGETRAAVPYRGRDWDGHISLVRIEDPEVIPPPTLPLEIAALLEPGDFASTSRGPPTIIVRARGGAYDAAEVVWSQKARSLELPAAFGPIQTVALSEDGAQGLLCDRRRLCCVEMATGALRVAWEAEPKILLCSAAFAAGGRIAVSTFDGILLLEPKGAGRFEPTSSYPCSPGTLIPYGDGRLLFVESSELWVFGLVGGELEALATMEGPARLLHVAEGRAFGRDELGRLEVAGIAAAYASLSPMLEA